MFNNKQAFEKIVEQHGDRIALNGGMLLFQDGYRMSPDGMSRREPPTNPVELLELQRQFYSVKLAETETRFYNLKNDLLEAEAQSRKYANLPTVADPRALEALKAMQTNVLNYRKQLAEIATKIEASKQNETRRFDEEMRARELAEQAAFMSEVHALEI